ncbi:MAG: hypothetical protein ABSB19_16405, partial [Methylomonas sp.]
VGILDQAKQGYMFHDRVKKGFSGGPVSLHKQNKVLGVISQRSKEDQETLFIPIYKFKDWLTPYLQTDLTIQDNGASEVRFNGELIIGSARYIERPQTAYTKILNQLMLDKNPGKETNRKRPTVKAYLYLCEDHDSRPLEFGYALGMRLKTGIKQQINKELLDSDGGRIVYSLKVNPWDWANKFEKDEFFEQCLEEIGNHLKIDSPKNKLSKRIWQKILDDRSPVIMVSNGPENPHYLIGDAISKIDKCSEWITELNERWTVEAKQVADKNNKAALVCIFCVPLHNIKAVDVQHDLRLQKITPKDFNSWKTDVENFLLEYYPLPLVTKQVKEIERKFSVLQNHAKDVDAAISYNEFIEYIES